LLARADRVVIDLGSGDGRAVLAMARREPGALVIGIDASAAGLAESSLRAARAPRKGGLPNALFVVAAAERPPAELMGIAAEVTVLFPWGSLLRGALAMDDACDAAAGIAALVAPGGVVRIVLSVDARDHLALPGLDVATREPLAVRWARHGLPLTAFEPVGAAEVSGLGSSWARRIAAGRDRAAWRIELCRPGESDRGSHDASP
jgi:16S rRNA (adenine(1408)-N(1))-methyltransferase